MAPELTKGAKFASPASDQYALGVMLYECATGRRPFTGESHYDLMHAIVTAKILAPSEIKDSLSPEFDELVMRAMHRQPASRFPSVQALGSALLSFGDKTAWALWEDEFLGVSEGGREPWNVGAGTLSDSSAATTASMRTTRRRTTRWLKWTLGAVAAYAAVVTTLLGFQRPATVETTPQAPKATEPAAAPAAPPTTVATASTAASVAPAAPSPDVATATEPAATPTDVRAGQRPRKVNTAKERVNAASSALPPSAPVASATPHPASTVGTNGAPIVE
jgi:serine/threonine-protein kinase